MARITRIALDMALDASKALRSASGVAWQYIKTEAVPPMTLNFFHGSGGKKLENAVSKATNNFIAEIQNRIQEIEHERLREIALKEAKAKALQEQMKVEAERRSEKVNKLTKQANVKQKAGVKIGEAKNSTSTVKTEETKKTVKIKPKKKQAKRRKESKTHRREIKRGSPPKTRSK